MNTLASITACLLQARPAGRESAIKEAAVIFRDEGITAAELRRNYPGRPVITEVATALAGLRERPRLRVVP